MPLLLDACDLDAHLPELAEHKALSGAAPHLRSSVELDADPLAGWRLSLLHGKQGLDRHPTDTRLSAQERLELELLRARAQALLAGELEALLPARLAWAARLAFRRSVTMDGSGVYWVSPKTSGAGFSRKEIEPALSGIRALLAPHAADLGPEAHDWHAVFGFDAGIANQAGEIAFDASGATAEAAMAAASAAAWTTAVMGRHRNVENRLDDPVPHRPLALLRIAEAIRGDAVAGLAASCRP